MLNEESEQLEFQKESKRKKVYQKMNSARQIISSGYKDSKLFLGIFFLIIPLSTIPINYYFPDKLIVFTSMVMGVTVIFSFWNMQYAKSTIKSFKNIGRKEYLNSLNVIERMPNIQLLSMYAFIIIIGTILLLFYIPTKDTTTETIRLILILLLIPDLLIFTFSTFYWLVFSIGISTRKNRDFYLSNAWAMSIEPKNTDSEKISNLKKCIENYDDFLSTTIKQRIANLEQLYVAFVLEDSERLTIIIKEIQEKYQDPKRTIQF